MTCDAPRFEPRDVAEILLSTDPDCRWVVAFSGGADSTALLLAACEIATQEQRQIEACHVHHGVNDHADAWAAHCQAVCDALDIPLSIARVCPDPESRKGPEAEMRDLRYKVLEDSLQWGDAILTAHHREDQAETLLLNLMRGSGPEGLAAMPRKRRLGPGWLIRPLLDWPRQSLVNHVRESVFDWIEDDSNASLGPDRNFLRHAVVPLLQTRWPGAVKALARSASHAGEHADLLRRDAEAALDGRIQQQRLLKIRSNEFDNGPVFKLLLRNWARLAGTPPIPAQRLEEFHRQCRCDPTTGKARLEWLDWRVIQDRDVLWMVGPNEMPVPCSTQSLPQRIPIGLGRNGGTLSLDANPNGEGPLEVGRRCPGDRLRLAPGQSPRSMKEIMAAARVPDWLRDSIPVIRGPAGVLAVGDWAMDPDWAANGGEIHWRPGCASLRLVQARARHNMVATAGALG